MTFHEEEARALALLRDVQKQRHQMTNFAREYDHMAMSLRSARARGLTMARTLIAALDYLVLRNEFHKHLIGDLRVALNALGHHYGCS